MRGVIFNSMISTTVTMPALVLLFVMGLYLLRSRCFPDAEPKPGIFALLAAMLPLAITFILWPEQRYSNYPDRTGTIVCTYILYYLVGIAIYATCSQMGGEARRRAFNFFFVLLSAVAVVATLLTFRDAAQILALFGLAILVVWGIFNLVTKTIASTVWTWTPPQTPPEKTQDAAPPPEPLLPGVQRLLIYIAAVVVVTWLCLYVYTLSPFYVLLVLFWCAVAGGVLSQAGISPAPSPPSREAD